MHLEGIFYHFRGFAHLSYIEITFYSFSLLAYSVQNSLSVLVANSKVVVQIFAKVKNFDESSYLSLLKIKKIWILPIWIKYELLEVAMLDRLKWAIPLSETTNPSFSLESEIFRHSKTVKNWVRNTFEVVFSDRNISCKTHLF